MHFSNPYADIQPAYLPFTPGSWKYLKDTIPFFASGANTRKQRPMNILKSFILNNNHGEYVFTVDLYSFSDIDNQK
jgi:hypothetical protein